MARCTSVEVQQPVGVVVVDPKGPGKRGAWRRMSLDLQTFGFIWAWASLIRDASPSEELEVQLGAFQDAARQWPMDFYFFGVKPDIENAIFLKSFDIMESYRKNEEMHAPGGWQICVLFHQAQVLQHGSSVQGKTDPVTDLCNFFKGYEFAASSDYTRLDNKLAKECLTVYDRVMASPTSEEILIQARVHLGPKTTSKLIMISQRTAACRHQENKLCGHGQSVSDRGRHDHSDVEKCRGSVSCDGMYMCEMPTCMSSRCWHP